MDVNALEAAVLALFKADAAMLLAFTTMQRGIPEGLPMGWFESGQLPALMVEVRPVSSHSGMSTTNELERWEPVQVFIVCAGTVRDMVRTTTADLVKEVERVVNTQRGNAGGLGANHFLDAFIDDEVMVLQQGELFYGIAKPGLTVRCFETF